MTQTTDADTRLADGPVCDSGCHRHLADTLAAVRDAAACVTALAAADLAVGFNNPFAQFLDCRVLADDAGSDQATLRHYADPVRRAVARSRLAHLLQVWPREYPGDFETIELLCVNRAIEASVTFAGSVEAWTLACPPVQQHRNKVAFQSRAIVQGVEPGATRILSWHLVERSQSDIAAFCRTAQFERSLSSGLSLRASRPLPFSEARTRSWPRFAEAL